MANTAAVMTSLDSIGLQDRPMPEPGPGREVLRGEAVETLADASEYRLDVAAAHGFAMEQSGTPADRTFSVLPECPAAAGVLPTAPEGLHGAGRTAVIGLGKAGTVPLPLSVLTRKAIARPMVNRYNNMWPPGIALAAPGRINLDGLVTHEFAPTAPALENTSAEPKPFKAMVHPRRT